jgi:hypothetical protein
LQSSEIAVMMDARKRVLAKVRPRFRREKSVP